MFSSEICAFDIGSESPLACILCNHLSQCKVGVKHCCIRILLFYTYFVLMNIQCAGTQRIRHVAFDNLDPFGRWISELFLPILVIRLVWQTVDHAEISFFTLCL
ncbi:hypothetical protein KIL84_008853 [Mauremys mutica]|uniref:Uncharacterized protein n=1 Tax=Mauremys mutica TaxID=74926 RepID=A0A9D3X7D7_9SAUR|nr:hypothetical protein KIL84_008853 [Mauremys mutica]